MMTLLARCRRAGPCCWRRCCRASSTGSRRSSRAARARRSCSSTATSPSSCARARSTAARRRGSSGPGRSSASRRAAAALALLPFAGEPGAARLRRRPDPPRLPPRPRPLRHGARRAGHRLRLRGHGREPRGAGSPPWPSRRCSWAWRARRGLPGALSLSGIFSARASPRCWAAARRPSLLIAAAFLLVFLAENSRIPFDDPNTHLELTMIHEVMVLDHGGPDLALIEYGASLKLWVLGSLLVDALVPPLRRLARATWRRRSAGWPPWRSSPASSRAPWRASAPARSAGPGDGLGVLPGRPDPGAGDERMTTLSTSPGDPPGARPTSGARHEPPRHVPPDGGRSRRCCSGLFPLLRQWGELTAEVRDRRGREHRAQGRRAPAMLAARCAWPRSGARSSLRRLLRLAAGRASPSWPPRWRSAPACELPGPLAPRSSCPSPCSRCSSASSWSSRGERRSPR